MGRTALLSFCCLALSASTVVRASPTLTSSPVAGCSLSVIPRVEGPVAPATLNRMIRDYTARVGPAVLRSMGARCSERDSVALHPLIRDGRFADRGMPAMEWTSEASVEMSDR